MLSVDRTIYAVSSVESSELMKVFDLNGKLIRQFGNDKDQTLFIDVNYSLV